VERLPDALVTIEVPPHLAPSALGGWGGCVLKLVASSVRPLERLPSGPEAAIGVLVHRVLECWSRGKGAPDPFALFDEECERVSSELRADPARRHFADLVASRSLQEWTRLRASTAERCLGLERREPSPSLASPGRAVLAGTERVLESSRLRLRGRADRIKALGTAVYEVRDFKTGNVYTAEDEVKPEIQLQLRAYGLMVLEVQAGARVRLVVDDGTDREVSFDADARATALEDITKIVDRVPDAGPADARSLANPGVGCAGCSIRHLCSAYRAEAPHWWKDFPPALERAPNDVWGCVQEVRPSLRVAATDLLLLDAAGRRVRVDGLDARHSLEGLGKGAPLWLFQLEGTGPSRGFDGRRFHPRAFHELPRDKRERRGWSTVCFSEAVNP
jgi:RecB family exonuclease